MREQLRLLADLQLLDSRLHALRDEHDQLPQQLKAYEQACEQARERLDRVQAEIAEAETQRRALERRLDDDQERLLKTQSRLHEIKTNKEYSAVLAEIDSGKERIAQLEDRVLELMETGDAQRQSTKAYEQYVQDASQALEEHSQKVQDAQRELAEQLSFNDAEREQLLLQLDGTLLAAYEQSASRHRGVGAVRVIEGTCEGCHLRIQPQLVSEIRLQESIVKCPHCQRILLWPA